MKNNIPYEFLPHRENNSKSPEKRNLSSENKKDRINNYGNIDKSFSNITYYPDGTCWACDVGCSVSTTGYSPMTFSPYRNTIRRRDVTPVKNNVKYEQYTRHKKERNCNSFEN